MGVHATDKSLHGTDEQSSTAEKLSTLQYTASDTSIRADSYERERGRRFKGVESLRGVSKVAHAASIFGVSRTNCTRLKSAIERK